MPVLPMTTLPSEEQGVALVIGNFDGVHRGHQALVKYTVELAARFGLRARAMTFDPHPAMLLSGKAPAVLTQLTRKVSLLCASAPNFDVIVQPFDRQFANLLPREFVERILVNHVHVRQLVVGANFRFGRDRAGCADDFVRFGEELGFAAHAFELSGDAQGCFSSSRIRCLVAEGELSQARALLGRPHAISGSVIRGDGRGRTIGFATANLGGVEEQLPPEGVYAALAQLLPSGPVPSSALCPAAVHIGPRPTVDRDASIEAHLIGHTGEIYDRGLRLHLLRRLRGLVRFDGIEALKAQISLDVQATSDAAAASDPFVEP